MVRNAVVTGASRGIGLEIARRLAGEGYALVITARRGPDLAEVAERLHDDFGVAVLPVVANLASTEDVCRLAGEVEDRFTMLDVLVLNAGVGILGTVAEQPLKTFDLVFAVNVRAQFQILQRMLPLLRSAAAERPARGAKIIALASITGTVSEPGMAAYAASKAALVSLCETVTLEESRLGVTASVISPGYVDTDMTVGVRATLDQDAMLTSGDVAEIAMAASRMSAHAVMPNAVISRAGEQVWRA